MSPLNRSAQAGMGSGVEKLTAPQWEMLRDAARKPRRVVRGYKPAAKLAELGLAEIAVTEGAYAWIVAATTAGHEALAARATEGV